MWFKQHPNATFIFTLILAGIMVRGIVTLDPYSTGLLAMGMVLAIVVLLAISSWMLKQKQRSQWYLPLAIFPFGWVWLVALESKRTIPETNNKEDDTDKVHIPRSDIF